MPEPDSQIEVSPDILNHLREISLTPVTLRKIFLLFTRSHYSTANNYGKLATKMGSFVWTPGKISSLFIDLDYHYDPKDMDRRPAIFVGCGDIVYEQVMLDGRIRNTEDQSGQEFHDRAVTEITIRHVGKTPDESLQLADLSSQFFRALRKVMKNQMELTRYVVARITSSKVFDKDAIQADKHFVSDVIISLAFNESWTIFTESHRLKEWTFDDFCRLSQDTPPQ